jgi:hypothetical protein
MYIHQGGLAAGGGTPTAWVDPCTGRIVTVRPPAGPCPTGAPTPAPAQTTWQYLNGVTWSSPFGGVTMLELILLVVAVVIIVGIVLAVM